ncbi:hypothetical protein L915_14359 [Phytophthora nicotianae]|uniref:Uncharacterized protein n=1 Tax=Phytophthora nicotianae TaxID=4792 RepID=W2IIA1_PHYNI|nr:hypothetical protein L915_14359 [Phytophthora nicotianae]ETL33227.1 hypothetical protein L916_14263 [Phytophthora nicotianae]ETM39636.1 hypothetical protein L914_14222 [Phytophthora nicotianae]
MLFKANKWILYASENTGGLLSIVLVDSVHVLAIVLADTVLAIVLADSVLAIVLADSVLAIGRNANASTSSAWSS